MPLTAYKVCDKKEVSVNPEEGYGEIVSEVLECKLERNKLPVGQDLSLLEWNSLGNMLLLINMRSLSLK